MTGRGSRRGPAFVALVTGGIGVGIAEFATMGVLPQIAAGLGVSIPRAGAAISAYALGVVIGAPLIALGAARAPRRAVLLVLMTVFTLGNLAAALAPDFRSLILARFVSGLPHGAYFGLAALVAVSLAPRGQGGRAVGTVMLGIPIAMLVGVPLGTWAGQVLGWRVTYTAVAAIGALTVVLIRAWVPRTPGDPTASWRTELRAFTSLQFCLTAAVGAVGFGGIFAMYSYIAPTVTEVTGRTEHWVPWFLLLYGAVSIVATWIGGRLADWSVLRALVLTGTVTAVGLLAFHWTAQWLVPALLTLALIALGGSSWVVALQVRMMAVAGAARTLGAAMNHASLNLANALGAWLGGLVIAAGYGYRSPALVGAGLAVAGLLVLGVSVRLRHRA